MCSLHSGFRISSYIWRHLDIGYVQGMCDLLAPLLVILDDGESTHWIMFYSSLRSDIWCIFHSFWWRCLPTRFHFLPSARSFVQRPWPSAVSPSSWREWIKTFHTEELWTPTLPTCALLSRYNTAPVRSSHIRLALPHVSSTTSVINSFSWISSVHRSWTRSCLSWCTRTETTPTSTSATAGSSSTSSEVKVNEFVPIRDVEDSLLFNNTLGSLFTRRVVSY